MSFLTVDIKCQVFYEVAFNDRFKNKLIQQNKKPVILRILLVNLLIYYLQLLLKYHLVMGPELRVKFKR